MSFIVLIFDNPTDFDKKIIKKHYPELSIYSAYVCRRMDSFFGNELEFDTILEASEWLRKFDLQADNNLIILKEAFYQKKNENEHNSRNIRVALSHTELWELHIATYAEEESKLSKILKEFGKKLETENE